MGRKRRKIREEYQATRLWQERLQQIYEKVLPMIKRKLRQPEAPTREPRQKKEAQG
jgi:hypothetical protein